jgi:hypothetical protein
MPSAAPTHSLQNSIHRGQKEKHYEDNITLANSFPRCSGALRSGNIPPRSGNAKGPKAVVRSGRVLWAVRL